MKKVGNDFYEKLIAEGQGPHYVRTPTEGLSSIMIFT
jgi:hypothetical protein